MSDCKQSPFALDKQHVYEITGKCIYCNEMNPVHEEVTKKMKCPGVTDLDKMAAIHQMNGSISAANTRVAGMIAENKQCENLDLDVAYRMDAFQAEANNIDHYVSNIRVMRKYL